MFVLFLFKCRFFLSCFSAVRRSSYLLPYIYNYINCNILDSFAFPFSVISPSNLLPSYFFFSQCMIFVLLFWWKLHVWRKVRTTLDECVYLLPCTYVALLLCVQKSCANLFTHSLSRKNTIKQVTINKCLSSAFALLC